MLQDLTNSDQIHTCFMTSVLINAKTANKSMISPLCSFFPNRLFSSLASSGNGNTPLPAAGWCCVPGYNDLLLFAAAFLHVHARKGKK